MNTQQQPKQSNAPKARIPLSIWILGGGIIALLIFVAVIIGANSAKVPTVEEARQAAMVSQGGDSGLPPLTPEDLKALRAQETQILTSYGWVDKEAGIVRIPIDKAMDLALEQADYYKQWAVEESAATGAGTGGEAQPVGDAPSAADGEKLFYSAGCVACHAVDAVLVGPALGNLYGEETTLDNGEKVKVDEAYLRESILAPNAKIVEGFVGAMPPFEGMLSDAQVSSLIEYIKSLSSAP